LGKAQVIFGLVPASGGNPSFQKKLFKLSKIMKRFLNFCGYVFGLGKARVIFGPEPSQ
jgi:hypothetical protein